MIKICDAQMGMGKTTALIKYMNANSNEKFIYITPFLSEVERVYGSCPNLHFRKPSNKLPEYHYSKVEHTNALLRENRNIVTTHQALKFYTKETIELIKDFGYTLVIDESVDMLNSFQDLNFSKDDLRVLEEGDYVKNEGDRYILTKNDYSDGKLKNFFRYFESRELVNLNDSKDTHYWALPMELITSFKDVFVLTYLFSCQSLHHLLEINKVPYEYIGVRQVGERDYELCNVGESKNYISGIGHLINIVENPRMNDIGKNKHSLSRAWYEKSSDNVEIIRKNIYNYFRNIHRGIKPEYKMWTCFAKDKPKIKGKGYSKGFLTFNTKATNDYRHKTILAYPINVFMNVGEKNYYRSHGIEVDEDKYALSVLLQWIWRSAIRDGKPVELYLPSKRMRDILRNWIEETSN